MALLLLLCGGFWAHVVSLQSLENVTSLLTPTPKGFSNSSVSSISEALNLNSDTSTEPIKGAPQEVDSTESEISTTFRATAASPVGTPTGASTGLPIPEPTASQEASPTKSPVLPETSNTTSDPAVPIAGNSLGDSAVAGENMTSDFLETASVTDGPPVTMATSSLESSHETNGPSVTMTTSPLKISSETHGPSVTMATRSWEPSSETSGPPVTTAFSSGEPSSVASGSPVSSIKTYMTTTAKLSTSASSGSTLPLDQKSKGRLLMPLLVALLVVMVLVALLLLWRQRQKRRTGALTLTRGGKRNGVVDAWAGPARVPDEEAVTIGGGSGADKGSRVPETEEPGQRPTLTTFFGRRKSRQGSVALEELRSGPGLKGEEEPLVGSEAEDAEASTSTGPEVRDGAVPQSL